MPQRVVFVTGGTGYIGSALIPELLKRNFAVHALVRPGSASKLPSGALPIIGDALDAESFGSAVPHDSTFVHLVGTPHPGPGKAAEFRRVDLTSIQAAVDAARSKVRHFVYLSVAQPAPVMQAYIAVRRAGEALIEESTMPATILRPWYVLGPGHRWPYSLLPLYAILERLPATRASAQRLGMITLSTMIAALVCAIETPPKSGMRIWDVSTLRREATAHT